MTLSILAMLATTTSANAGQADLQTTVMVPASSNVYVDDTVSVEVANIGSRPAHNVMLTIQLPETHTSPTVQVMGILGDYDSNCVEVGTTLECDLGRIKRGKDRIVDLDIALPWSINSLDFDATADTTSPESSTANNTDGDSATVLYPDLVVVGPASVTNTHCTGMDLQGFYECVISAGSTSNHYITLNDDTSISFDFPDYTGTWGQDTDDHLWFEYRYLGSVVAEFEGNAVDGACFEGLTTFPGSAWVSAYEVCLD